VATLEELEARVARLEQLLASTREQAAAARILAGGADQEVSEFKGTLNAHTRALGALRETQVEQGQKLDALESKVDDGFSEMREGFAKVGTGMAQINALLRTLVDRDTGDH